MSFVKLSASALAIAAVSATAAAARDQVQPQRCLTITSGPENRERARSVRQPLGNPRHVARRVVDHHDLRPATRGERPAIQRPKRAKRHPELLGTIVPA